MSNKQVNDFQVGDKLVRYGNARFIHTVVRTTPHYVYTDKISGRVQKCQFRFAKNSEVVWYEQQCKS